MKPIENVRGVTVVSLFRTWWGGGGGVTVVKPIQDVGEG